ncbi:MAG: hypothetical protein QHG98_00390 [Methanothrix sp.]|jgi:hypothetical protein|uniref:hypothetical protein n=1 Tax=Methanothrix sp. TaxID=90426 RepID=UPI00247BCBA3|nr:hypothetical protein [Methanothrix sp.]
MEYVIRINDSAGEGEPEPISLRLPPGGSDEIHLRVVNLGEPTNLVVKTDQGIIRYVKPEKMNHYIVLEEMIPISVRMPETAETVSGDVLLITDTATKKIPVTLEADGMYRDDSEDEGLRENESHDDYGDGYDDDEQRDEGYYKSDQYYRHNSWTGSRDGESIDRYEPVTGYGRYSMDLVPVALILAATIMLMVLTFHTRTLPLFHGALATSMMIVSLIIYGTATMLRS